ncbi:hypothetical protein [Paenibacillus senegalensis]|uniref:hypothetical protein n=1 Tax=Paenibacillus senegalensis TaxID=1465766 RepID=UPI000287B18A|nr:hypothetical protein [Paenibacillus senegalensis]
MPMTDSEEKSSCNNQANNRQRKRIAVIATEYRYNSHAEMIVGRLLGNFGYKPQVIVASLYTDQLPPNDQSREEAAKHHIPIMHTVPDTIRYAAEHGGLDGVVIIGEHGDYPVDSWGRKQYPRRRFIEETLQILDDLKLRVPLFSDKFLAWNLEDSLWIFEQLKARNIPFFGGSSIPHVMFAPPFDQQHLKEAHEWLIVSFSNEVEAYGYHALELLQALAEKRRGGETGIAAITVTRGPAVWEAMDRDEWPELLMQQALDLFREQERTHPRMSAEIPVLFVVEYIDGSKGYVIQQNGLSERWRFSFRTGQKQIISSLCASGEDRPFSHFDTYTSLIERFLLTGIEPIPAERILFSSVLINRAMEALAKGRTIYTPELKRTY